MCYALGKLWTELKIVAHFFSPCFCLCFSRDLIECGIEFNGVEMTAIVFKKIGLLGLFRINFTDPVFASPFCAPDVEVRFAFVGSFQYGRIARVLRWQLEA